ncbi:TetR/AcrR family transcriptional regulator C-terminal domain-containing protein [Clostridium sp.]
MSNSQITKLALADAMKELMNEKPMYKITISDITNRQMLNRKSFYYHFKDKYDLVNWIFYTDFVSTMQNSSPSDIWDLLENICEYFYENKGFYCNALSEMGQNSFPNYFMEVMEPFMLIKFGDIFKDSKYKEFLSVYFSDAARAAITRWLVEDKNTPPDKFVNFIRCAMEGLAIKVVEDIKEV